MNFQLRMLTYLKVKENNKLASTISSKFNAIIFINEKQKFAVQYKNFSLFYKNKIHNLSMKYKQQQNIRILLRYFNNFTLILRCIKSFIRCAVIMFRHAIYKFNSLCLQLHHENFTSNSKKFCVCITLCIHYITHMSFSIQKY